MQITDKKIVIFGVVLVCLAALLIIQLLPEKRAMVLGGGERVHQKKESRAVAVEKKPAKNQSTVGKRVAKSSEKTKTLNRSRIAKGNKKVSATFQRRARKLNSNLVVLKQRYLVSSGRVKRRSDGLIGAFHFRGDFTARSVRKGVSDSGRSQKSDTKAQTDDLLNTIGDMLDVENPTKAFQKRRVRTSSQGRSHHTNATLCDREG